MKVWGCWILKINFWKSAKDSMIRARKKRRAAGKIRGWVEGEDKVRR